MFELLQSAARSVWIGGEMGRRYASRQQKERATESERVMGMIRLEEVGWTDNKGRPETEVHKQAGSSKRDRPDKISNQNANKQGATIGRR